MLMLPFKLVCEVEGQLMYVQKWATHGADVELTSDLSQAYMFRAVATGCREAYFVIEPELAGDIWEYYQPVPWR